jgi:hypothetical protein
MKWRWMIAVLMALVIVPGCGAKGRPVAPELTHPERVNDLAAKQDAKGIRLTWSRPTKYTGGKSLNDLAGFRLLRARRGGTLSDLADLPINDQERFQKVRRFAYVDNTAQVGRTYTYAMVAETADGYESDLSNVVEITRAAPQPPITPENFKMPKPTPLPDLPSGPATP